MSPRRIAVWRTPGMKFPLIRTEYITARPLVCIPGEGAGYGARGKLSLELFAHAHSPLEVIGCGSQANVLNIVGYLHLAGYDLRGRVVAFEHCGDMIRGNPPLGDDPVRRDFGVEPG